MFFASAPKARAGSRNVDSPADTSRAGRRIGVISFSVGISHFVATATRRPVARAYLPTARRASRAVLEDNRTRMARGGAFQGIFLAGDAAPFRRGVESGRQCVPVSGGRRLVGGRAESELAG